MSALQKRDSLNRRYELTVQEYDRLLDLGLEWMFGTKDKEADTSSYQEIYDRSIAGRGLLVLKKVANYHREYQWS